MDITAEWLEVIRKNNNGVGGGSNNGNGNGNANGVGNSIINSASGVRRSLQTCNPFPITIPVHWHVIRPVGGGPSNYAAQGK